MQMLYLTLVALHIVIALALFYVLSRRQCVVNSMRFNEED